MAGRAHSPAAASETSTFEAEVMSKALFAAYTKAICKGEHEEAKALLQQLERLAHGVNSHVVGDLTAEALFTEMCYSSGRSDQGELARALAGLRRLGGNGGSSLAQRKCLSHALAWLRQSSIAAEDKHAADQYLSEAQAIEAMACTGEEEASRPGPRGLAVYPLFWSTLASSPGDEIGQLARLWEVAAKLLEQGDRPWFFDFCELIEKHFAEAEDPRARNAIAAVLFGVAAAKPDDRTSEIAIYDRLLGRFAPMLDAVALTMFNRALRHTEAKETLAAIEMYCRLIDTYGRVSDPLIRYQVAMALVNRGALIVGHGRPELALQDFNRVVVDFGRNEHPRMLRQRVIALHNKALALLELKRYSEGVSSVDELVRELAGSTDPEMIQVVASAMETRKMIEEADPVNAGTTGAPN
jgi:tetratricopeptide (TPR) repeat protein